MKRLLLIATIALALLLPAAPASAAEWSAPGDAPLTGTLVKGSGAWLELPWTTLKSYPGISNLRSLEVLPSGELLMAQCLAQGMAPGTVSILDPDSGAAVWTFQRADLAPWNASMSPDGSTVLITSRIGPGMLQAVVGIDRATGTEVWRYELPAPFFATQLADPDGAGPGVGNVLICDNSGGRVLEVSWADRSIVWSYQFTSPRPKYAQRLPDGTTLVATDNGIFEITQSGQATLLFPGLLYQPVSCVRLEDGSTLVAEESALSTSLGRVVCIAADGQILWEYSANSTLGLDGAPNTPRRALPGREGSVVIAEQNTARIVEVGHVLSGDGTSAPSDCGLPGVRKLFTSIVPDVDLPPGTTAGVEYSVDGGAWQPLTGSALPAGTYGKLIAYRVSFSSDRHDKTPRLRGIVVTYEAAPEDAAGSSGSGSGSGSTSGTSSGTNKGAGSGRSPSTPAGGTGAAQSAVPGPVGGTGISTYAGRAPLDSGSSLHRGFAMARLGSSTLSGGGEGGGSSPAPPLRGVLALGLMYFIGVLSVPLQRLLGSLLGLRPL